MGEVQLAMIEQPQGMAAFSTVNAGSRVKALLEKMNDSDVQDCINEAGAIGLWNDSPKGGFVYEYL